MSDPLRLDEVRRWVFDDLLPVWADAGVDEPGLGFRECLTLEGRPHDPGFKRVRVQGRQIYVYSHAHLLGAPGALETARRGYEFLLANAWAVEGGWAKKLDRRGAVLDPTLDLYDNAFVLYGLAWLHRASGDPEPLRWAERTWEAISTRLARPDGLGFQSMAPSCGEQRQNPHMHLLEAVLALKEATGEERWQAEAVKLSALFAGTLFEPGTGTLVEYFDEDWCPRAGERGRIRDPGHHFEWVWLLHRHDRLTCEHHDRFADALLAFAEAKGLHPATRLAYDEVLNDGAVVTPAHRLWLQTEALKAWLAIGERTGQLNTARIGEIVGQILDRFVAPAPRGCWIDRLDADGRPMVDEVPASIVYHLLLAFTELLRVAEAQGGDPASA